MPKYTYKCKNCGIEFNEKLPIEDSDKEITCIACGEVAKKIIKNVNIVMPKSKDFVGKIGD